MAILQIDFLTLASKHYLKKFPPVWLE